MRREARVPQRIFVRAIQPGVARKLAKPLQRAVHLRGRAFEQPPATHHEQSVADESHPRVTENEGDMTEGVTGHLPYLGIERANPHPVALAQFLVDARHPVALGCRAVDGAAGRILHLKVPAGMIRVPVSSQHLTDAPPALLRSAQRSAAVARIHHRHRTRGRVPQQPDVIVAERRNRDDLRRGRAHHSPVFAIEAHGSAGAFAPPFCSSSMLIRSGVLMKAMRPSRGGRLIVTPASISRWHVS